MHTQDLHHRLIPFCRHHLEDENAEVLDVDTMPGHAGFSYGFSVKSHGETSRWFIRLPPPNVNWRGTADVLRQVAVLNALDGTEVPHCTIQWSGDDLKWFGCPYFVVPLLDGDVLRVGPGEWGSRLSEDQCLQLGREIMEALANIHRVDPARASYLGAPVPFDEDVKRWDRFYDRAADPHLLALVPECREKLLNTLPSSAPIGIFHGDFQTSNLFCSLDGHLKAVIDWELTGVGATLNDVGWICTFSDRAAWHQGSISRPIFLDPETLSTLYVDAYGDPLPDIRWYRALAAYKFAIITGFNLSLHRRGKRPDPSWEQTKLSMKPLIDRALELLG
ncbi:MAG: phosphotransferase family protein [Gammaproteobacteria bacterium]|nr:phosphotransferase family protein [Gammaproteobacteria bacterium]